MIVYTGSIVITFLVLLMSKENLTKKDVKKNVQPAKYILIKQYICQRIESGHWAQHHKVPSENELTQQFDVSRMTARRALQELTAEGILTRVQGSGTFVSTFKCQSSQLDIHSIKDQIILRGQQHQLKVLILKQQQITEEVASLMNLKNTDAIFYTQVMHFENDQPVQLEQRYVNTQLVPEYLLQSFTKITPHEYLLDAMPLTETLNSIEAINAPNDICLLLNINSTIPCLQIKQKTCSSKGIVSFAIFTSSGDKYRLGLF